MRVVTRMSLPRAVELTRTGDLWLFRGRSGADRAIQNLTNSPVNHVGMAVVVDDLPPLLWHAELGRALTDAWSGDRHRGVQLHDLRAAVLQWGRRYGQRGWLRQLSGPTDPAVTPEMDDALLRTIARLDGTPFPSTARLAGRWLRGRLPALRARGPHDGATVESAYCAEVVAVTYEDMGLLPRNRRAQHRRRAGTTPAGSGAATGSSCARGTPWAARSRSASRREPAA